MACCRLGHHLTSVVIVYPRGFVDPSEVLSHIPLAGYVEGYIWFVKAEDDQPSYVVRAHGGRFYVQDSRDTGINKRPKLQEVQSGTFAMKVSPNEHGGMRRFVQNFPRICAECIAECNGDGQPENTHCCTYHQEPEQPTLESVLPPSPEVSSIDTALDFPEGNRLMCTTPGCSNQTNGHSQTCSRNCF